jgi:hypothetical protein
MRFRRRKLGTEPGDPTPLPTFAPEFHTGNPVELSNKSVLRRSPRIAALD